MYFCTFLYFKTSQKKTTIDPDNLKKSVIVTVIVNPMINQIARNIIVSSKFILNRYISKYVLQKKEFSNLFMFLVPDTT